MITGPIIVVRPSAQINGVGAGLIAGPNGESAFQLAVDQGFAGTLSQWLATLVGSTGPIGPQGLAGVQGPQGGVGLTGATGPQPWITPPTPWASSTAYSAGPPASTVTYSGESYVCSTGHTSTTTFDATKWTKLAAKGADGSPSAGAVLYNSAQILTLAQQLQGRQNLGDRGAGILVKTAAYTIATTDAGKLIAANGTFALTLPSAASAGNGFAIEVSNTGTGKITLTPNGSDTIGGSASLIVNQKESGTLVSDGTNWQVIGFAPVIVASSAANRSGYIRYSNGYTKQWGISSGTDFSVTFPLAYTFIPVVTANFYNGGTTSTVLYSVHLSRLDTAGFDGRGRFGNGGTTGAPTGGEQWAWTAEGFI